MPTIWFPQIAKITHPHVYRLNIVTNPGAKLLQYICVQHLVHGKDKKIGLEIRCDF
jgi:hypothetical protein